MARLRAIIRKNLGQIGKLHTLQGAMSIHQRPLEQPYSSTSTPLQNGLMELRQVPKEPPSQKPTQVQTTPHKLALLEDLIQFGLSKSIGLQILPFRESYQLAKFAMATHWNVRDYVTISHVYLFHQHGNVREYANFRHYGSGNESGCAL